MRSRDIFTSISRHLRVVQTESKVKQPVTVEMNIHKAGHDIFAGQIHGFLTDYFFARQINPAVTQNDITALRAFVTN